ncbi:protein neprosin-like [Vicia villosa]|uniref:protein neprosin-like n=1 Tax=Vicia villosa TaxID=3911 RepID=UPI00273B1359|nr:protein neprosin-like [Vicia villosa]
MKFNSPIISFLLHLIFLVTFISPIYSSKTNNHQIVHQSLQYVKEYQKINKTIKTHLQQINKPAIKSIQSPDGDIIDCVLFQNQPAFDLPLFEEYKSLDFQGKLKVRNQINNLSVVQSWSLSGEFCPEGTIPIRRTKEQEIRFGRKDMTIPKRIYEVITFVQGHGYHGAKASLNVWAPQVENGEESSSAKIWVQSPTAKESIEAGWQVFPKQYGDHNPRLFIYWTADAYQSTGCYNLHCPGFVQISKTIGLGAAITPVSKHLGTQYSFNLKIEQDQNSGHWWLEYGSGNGPFEKVGYWPYSLFKELNHEANLIQFGGEVVDLNPTGDTTATDMGSGQFPELGLEVAAFIRNMQVAVTHDTYIDLPNPEYLEEKPNCYRIKGGFDKSHGSYIFYGGPGRSDICL